MRNCFLFFSSDPRLLLVLLALSIGAFASPAIAQKDSKPKKIVLKTIEGLRFSPVRLSVKAGERIELHLENHDPNDQPHNFVLSEIGSLEAIQTASLAIGPEAVANGFVPETDAIIVHSKLLNPEERDVLTFDAPKKAGVYPYICTFPGHAMVMYGALYVDTKMRQDLASDPHVPELVRTLEREKKKKQLEVERPFVQRLFMPDAGPAAIAVALPGELNFCWDAGNCRLRYAWTGGFVDATRMWNSNGNSLGKLMGDVFWTSEAGEEVFGIQIGEAPPQKVRFRGYDLDDGHPVFRYQIDGVEVRETLRASEKSLEWTFQFDAPEGAVRILVPDQETVSVTATTGTRDGDHWTIPTADAAQFTLTLSPR